MCDSPTYEYNGRSKYGYHGFLTSEWFDLIWRVKKDNVTSNLAAEPCTNSFESSISQGLKSQSPKCLIKKRHRYTSTLTQYCAVLLSNKIFHRWLIMHAYKSAYSGFNMLLIPTNILAGLFVEVAEALHLIETDVHGAILPHSPST